MPDRSPPSLSSAAIRAREVRVRRIAEQFGFVGRTEYRHEYSRSGGAQYGQARSPENDVPIVYAEAFDRDANPDEFSLEALLAHERGHQILIRHPRIGRLVAAQSSPASEEILASLVGAMLCSSPVDQKNLADRAFVELLVCGKESSAATRLLETLWGIMEQML